MNKKKQRKDNEFDKNVCAFCAEPPDEKKCGKFFTSKFGYSVHQYCMFFSAALPQNGKDDEGFEGFLEQDVLKEIRRAGRLRCHICLKKGASAGCCDQNCRRGFHFTCGVDLKYLFQFYGQFRAYCCDHRLHQNTTSYPSKKAPCPICLESVPCRASHEILTTPCCKDVWFHRSCVQEQATVSGYFFRCAVCNDKDKFVQEMKQMGIYVPDSCEMQPRSRALPSTRGRRAWKRGCVRCRKSEEKDDLKFYRKVDAAWEDGNNFAELLEKYSCCDYPTCICPMGRKFSSDTGKWELVLCSSCGQFGAHVGCKDWGTNPPSLLCPTCRPVHEDTKLTTRAAEALTSNQGGGAVEKSTSNRKGKERPRKKQQHVDSDTDSDDISNVLNGLKRQAEDDFLNSDTSFFVQRAIAAGTAVIENSGPKKCRTSQSAAPIPSGCSSNRKRKAEDVKSDDEIMITKYVPGQKPQSRCQLCPKCNRRRPIAMNTPTSSPAKIPRKDFPSTGSTSAVGKNSGSTCTITKANMKRKENGYESENIDTEHGTLDTRRRKRKAEARKVKIADYEVLELAAERTDKSSVLLLPSEDKPGELEGNYVTKDEVLSNGNGQNDSPNKPPKSSSFWLSSVERLFQFLNPRSGPDSSEENSREAEEIRKVVSSVTCGSSVSKEKDKSEGDVDVTLAEQPVSSGGKSETTGERSTSFGKTSETAGARSVSLGRKSEATGEKSTSFGKTSETTGAKSSSLGKTSETAGARSVSLGKKSEATGEKSTSFGKTSETTGAKSSSLGKTSETTRERSESLVKTSSNGEANSTQMSNCNANTSKFSNSSPSSRDGKLCSRSGDASKNKDFQFLTKKAVLEAVIDHAMELKNSGKELKHRCVSSC